MPCERALLCAGKRPPCPNAVLPRPAPRHPAPRLPSPRLFSDCHPRDFSLAIELWLYERLLLYKEYKDDRDAFPPPFNVLQLLWDILRFFSRSAAIPWKRHTLWTTAQSARFLCGRCWFCRCRISSRPGGSAIELAPQVIRCLCSGWPSVGAFRSRCRVSSCPMRSHWGLCRYYSEAVDRAERLGDVNTRGRLKRGGDRL